MTDTHCQSFFGQNTGLILNSSSKTEPYIFFRCIKRKSNGDWEKPSKGEGKAIKCNLDEIIMILEVLNRRLLNWTIYHNYKGNKTTISFSWENKDTNTLWINIANYSKMLNFAQTEILKMILNHILKEKINYATSLIEDKINGTIIQDLNYNDINDDLLEIESYAVSKNNSENDLVKKDLFNASNQIIQKQDRRDQNLETIKEISQIDGEIKGETEKALLINFDSGQEIWIPKSTIHGDYSIKNQSNQKFIIDNWILKRNKVIT